MEEKEKVSIECPSCKNRFDKEDLTRSCANCFACSGCEMYICPVCRNEIVVQTMKSRY